MEPNEFREEFLDQVRARASAGENFTHAEFIEVCADLLGDAEELADFEACYYRGGGVPESVAGRRRFRHG